MADIVIKSRIIPKKLHDSIISRERLVNIIEDNISKNMILIIGSAGSGKTTLAIDFFTKKKKQYAWLYMALDINNFSSFANYLVQSFRQIYPDFGSKTLELLSSMIESKVLVNDEKNSINALIGTFSNEFINTFSDDVYIALDDWHNTENASWLTFAFNCLIDDFPPNLHMIITSRTLPEFNHPRLNAKRNLLKIDASELTFNADETGKLLKEIYSIKFGDDELKLLDNRTEGWITGLHLILQAYGKDFSTAISEGKIIDENIFMYFAEEIYKTLNPATQELLTVTSLVDSFDVDLCSRLPGIGNAQKLIDELKKKNIFLETTVSESPEGGKKITYSYHNLFKLFLQSKLNEIKNPEEISRIASEIFNYYLETGDIINAIEFALYSNDYDKASELITDSFEELLKNGRYELLERWLNKLPEEIIKSRTQLYFSRAILLTSINSDKDKAREIFNEISNREKKGSKYYILSILNIADTMIVKGKSAGAAEMLNNLLKECEDFELKINILNVLVKVYYSIGASHYPDLIKALDEALKICDELGLRSYHSQIYSYYGKFYLSSGEFAKALHYFRNVVQIEKNIYRKFSTLTDIVLLYAWSGEYLKAKETLDETIEIYNKFPINTFKASLLRVTAMNALENGDYETAIEKLTELNALDEKNNITYNTFWYYMVIAEAYILLNRKEMAKEYFDMAKNAMDPDVQHQKLEYDLHLALIKKNEKPDTQVEKVLLSSLKYYDSLDLVYSKSQAEFYLADFYYKTGRLQTALKYLKDSLDITSEKGFHSFITQDFISKRYLFDLAAANKIHNDYIQSIYSRLLERENYTWLSDECKKRWQRESISLYDIKLVTFGGVEIYVRGKLASDDKWIRKKSKLLLVYLLVNMELKHTKDKILNLFFGELSPSSAENIFHQAITNIRNAVKPYSEAPDEQLSFKGKKAKYEKVPPIAVSESFINYEDKILRIAPGYNYFVDVTEFIKLSNLVKSAEIKISDKEIYAKRALNLYQGEFLPGYYDDWVEELRMNLQNRFIELCEELLKILRENLNFKEIIICGEKLLNEDKLHSEAYIFLIEAYTKTGNINMAKKKFSQLLKLYNEEYGEKPDKTVLNRIENILS